MDIPCHQDPQMLIMHAACYPCAFRWSRAEAENFMMEVTGCGHDQAATSVTRIITLPAQATAPAYGLIKLRQLRGRAEEVLGEIILPS